ncbi:MAG: aldolase [Candidatus Latescibacteria bacterium]|nr:aldolase [Candidatus Latescibacterota bacterium]
MREENTLKKRVKNGEVVLGPFVNLSPPVLIEIAGIAGFDFVIIDMEHGPIRVETAQTLCMAADGVGLAPIIRVRKNDEAEILSALDVGAAGVQIPQISTREDALHAVKASKYGPVGERGLSPLTRAWDYSKQRGAAWHNEQTMVIVHVEGTRGIQNLDEIVAVEGLDVIFLGPYDLSNSLGIPGQVKDPRVVEMMKTAVGTIRGVGKAVGTFADDPETARMWIDAGIQYMSISVDNTIYLNACREIVKQVKV